MTTYDAAMETAAELGQMDGEAAASWVFDGNTERATYVAILAGLDNGDPAVLDRLPYPDLSGEWADGRTPKSLTEECGLDPDEIEDWVTDALCENYELAFSDAVHTEVERAARYQVEA